MYLRLLLLAAVCIWGWTFVANKICLDYLTPVELIGFRFAIGIPLMAATIPFSRQPLGLQRSDLMPIFLGGLVLAAHFIIQVIGMTTTTATNTGWLIAATPLAIMLLGWLFLKERIGSAQLTGSALAIVGVVLLVSRGDLASIDWLSSTGDWLVLTTAFTWAVYTIVVRRIVADRRPVVVTVAVFIPVLIVCFAWIIPTTDWSTVFIMPWESWVALLFLAIPGTFAQWIWQYAVRHLGASNTGYWIYLEPVATMLLAVPLLGEEFSLLVVVGGGLVILGVYLAQRKLKNGSDSEVSVPSRSSE